MPDPSGAPAGGQAAGGGFAGALKSKFGPLPTWAWLGIITVVLLGYWLLTKNKSGASSGSPGTSGTPADVGQPGVVVINQDSDTGTPGQPPPGPPPPPTGPPPEPHTRQITLDQDETLAQLAKQRHWTAGTLREVEQMNVTAGQGKLTPQSKLKKGQTIIRPLKG